MMLDNYITIMRRITMSNSILGVLVTAIVAGTAVAVQPTPTARPDLNDLEMAHVAVTANNTDIQYAHLALALSDNPDIREFAETMIRDHSAVNEQVAALAKRLGVTAQDNDVSRELRKNASKITNELSGLRGAEFDRRYAANEAAYHQSVNGLVAGTFIPNIENREVKKAFEGALQIFLVHQEHAEKLDHELNGMGMGDDMGMDKGMEGM
jgi:putative membrane protein